MIYFKKSVFRFYFLLILGAVSKTSSGQEDFKIITEDVFNFWQAYDSLHQGADTTATFQKLVIDRASEPFKKFIRKGNISAGNYTLQIRKYPRFYKSIRANSLRLAGSEKEIRLLVKKFRDIYPDMVSAGICIAFGNFHTGGTIYADNKTKLVYVGLEFHGLDSSAVVSEFNPLMKDYLSRSNFYRTIIHELVHVQQQTHGRSVTKAYYGDKLIHAVLREGIADFVAKHIYPGGNDGKYVEYGLQYEVLLKKKLEGEMWKPDKSYWIYNSNPTEGQPSDLGYFMGARIARAFYEKNKNKNVIKQIIEIKNIKEFIEQSGYFSE